VAGVDPAPHLGEAKSGAPAANNLLMRILSALVLAPIALAAAWYGGWPFALFWTLAAVAVLWEWITLVAGPDGHRLMFSSCASAIAVAALVDWRGRQIVAILLVGLGALAATIFAPRGRRWWIVGGIFYAGAMVLAPLLLRAGGPHGFFAILALFAIVWTTDVVAYCAGRAIGGPKLCSAISPKKTWSGAVAGTLGAMLVTAAGARLIGGYDPLAIALVALVLSAVAQLGDLLESWIKRQFGAKDASHLIPGHGGVMDRLDGFWAAALLGCLIGLSRGGFEDAASGLLLW
jgi:phosphatidate cytidylyltransferase